MFVELGTANEMILPNPQLSDEQWTRSQGVICNQAVVGWSDKQSLVGLQYSKPLPRSFAPKELPPSHA